VNGERLTPEVERERGKVTTWGKQTGSRLDSESLREEGVFARPGGRLRRAFNI